MLLRSLCLLCLFVLLTADTGRSGSKMDIPSGCGKGHKCPKSAFFLSHSDSCKNTSSYAKVYEKKALCWDLLKHFATKFWSL